MAEPVCAEPGCISAPYEAQLFCRIHVDAMRVKAVMEGEKCLRCRGPVRKGDWVTRASKPMTMTHITCPPAKRRR